MIRPLRSLLLVVAAASACDRTPATEAAVAPDGIGPFRLGMRQEELRAALDVAGVEMTCAPHQAALTFCERQDPGEPIQIAYALLAGRATYLLRQTRAQWAEAHADSLVSRWEARYGPPASTGRLETLDSAKVTVFRAWYAPGRSYRAISCGRPTSRGPECMELLVDPSPLSVGALVMSFGMERPSNVVCWNWDQVVAAGCTEYESATADAALASGSVLRAATIRYHPEPPAGARLLLEATGERFHYQVRRMRNGNLHGIVCWKVGGGGCKEIVARYQPKEFLTAVAQWTL